MSGGEGVAIMDSHDQCLCLPLHLQLFTPPTSPYFLKLFTSPTSPYFLKNFSHLQPVTSNENPPNTNNIRVDKLPNTNTVKFSHWNFRLFYFFFVFFFLLGFWLKTVFFYLFMSGCFQKLASEKITEMRRRWTTVKMNLED